MNVLERLFPVRRGERGLTLVMFLHNLFAVGAFIAGRSARDALFLAHHDRGSLAFMYVLSALAVAAVGLAYTPLAAHWRRDHVTSVTSAAFALLFVVAWAVERTGRPWIYAALYVFVEVMGSVALVQFWTLLNELFHAREARRLYGLIGSGGTIANIVVGLATSKIATRYGAGYVLLLCAAQCVGSACAATFAGRYGRERLFAKAATGGGRRGKGKGAGGASRVLNSGHLRTLAALAAVTFFTTTLVDYEFKVLAAGAYRQDQLAAYFGHFYAAVGVLALVLQLFGTGQLLNRVGVVGALAVLPASLAMGNLALGILGVLWAAALAKGADALFRYTVNDATTQLLYLPVAPAARASSKAFIDGVVKSAAIGLAGLFLIAYRYVPHASPALLAWVTLVLCAFWGVAVAATRTRYIRSLQENLRNRRLDVESAPFDVPESSAGKIVIRALESADPREVLAALELTPKLGNLELDDKVEPLLNHPVAELRIAALGFFAHRQTMRFANAIHAKFEDVDPKVRAAAIDAYCTVGRDKAVRSVRSYLADADPAVKSAAMVGMIRYGGLDGVLSAAEALKALISHDQTVMREHAARVLGAIGVRNFYQPVLELMNDREPSVRREAVRAAGVLRSPEFVVPLIYRTRTTETGTEAVEALSAYGAGIAPTLAKVLANPDEEVSIRRSVVRVLGRMGTPEALEILLQHLEDPDAELRLRLYRALAAIVRSQRLSAARRRQVQAALDLELTRAYHTLACAERLSLSIAPGIKIPVRGAMAAASLLDSALTEKVGHAEERVFLLLSALYPDAGMEHIYLGIRDAAQAYAGRRRANAVELLDNVLDRRQKRKLLPLVDDLPRPEKLRAVQGLLALRPLGERETLAELCRDESAWIRACALHYASEIRHPEAAESVLAASTDPDPVVRETALVTALLTRPELAASLAEMRLGDESDVVRRQAERIFGLRAAPAA